MNKTIIMDRLIDKETKGCHRYGFSAGDAGVSTLYIRKENMPDGVAPKRIRVMIVAETS